MQWPCLTVGPHTENWAQADTGASLQHGGPSGLHTSQHPIPASQGSSPALLAFI